MIIYFKLLKVSKMISFKIYVSPVMREAKNLKFRQQVNLIKTVPLGPLPQEIVLSLPYNNLTLTNLLISSYSGAVVIKFGQLKQLLNRSSQGTSPLGVVTSLPSDHVTLINLYMSRCRGATGATFIYATDFLFQIFCNNKIQQILQERHMLSWQLTYLFYIKQAN